MNRFLLMLVAFVVVSRLYPEWPYSKYLSPVDEDMQSFEELVVWAAFFLYGLGSYMYRQDGWGQAVYAVTNKRLVLSSYSPKRQLKCVPLAQVKEVLMMRRGLLGRILGYGTLVFLAGSDGSGGKKPERLMKWVAVPKPSIAKMNIEKLIRDT